MSSKWNFVVACWLLTCAAAALATDELNEAPELDCFASAEAKLANGVAHVDEQLASFRRWYSELAEQLRNNNQLELAQRCTRRQVAQLGTFLRLLESPAAAGSCSQLNELLVQLYNESHQFARLRSVYMRLIERASGQPEWQRLQAHCIFDQFYYTKAKLRSINFYLLDVVENYFGERVHEQLAQGTDQATSLEDAIRQKLAADEQRPKANDTPAPLLYDQIDAHQFDSKLNVGALVKFSIIEYCHKMLRVHGVEPQAATDGDGQLAAQLAGCLEALEQRDTSLVSVYQLERFSERAQEPQFLLEFLIDRLIVQSCASYTRLLDQQVHAPGQFVSRVLLGRDLARTRLTQHADGAQPQDQSAGVAADLEEQVNFYKSAHVSRFCRLYVLNSAQRLAQEAALELRAAS